MEWRDGRIETEHDVERLEAFLKEHHALATSEAATDRAVLHAPKWQEGAGGAAQRDPAPQAA